MDRRRLMPHHLGRRGGDQRPAGAGAAARGRQPGAALGADGVRLRLLAVNPPTRRRRSRRCVGPAGVPAANALAMTVRHVGVIVGPLLAGAAHRDGRAVPRLRRRRGRLPGRARALPVCRRCRRRRSAAAARPPCAACGEGLAFLRTQPVLLMTFVVDIIAMVFAWPQAVFPELSETAVRPIAEQPGPAVRRHLDGRPGWA